MASPSADKIISVFLWMIPTVVGIIISAIITITANSNDTQLKVFLFLFTGLFVIVCHIVVRHFQLHFTLSVIADSVMKSELLMKMNKRPSSFAVRCRLYVDHIDKAESAIEIHPELQSILDWKHHQILDEFDNIASGYILINDTSKEIVANSEFVTHHTKKSIKAISFRDKPFWSSPEGQNFIKIQSEAIKQKRITIERIFVLEPNESVADYKDIFSQQRAARIKVSWLSQSDATVAAGVGADELDFVIYDELFVRKGLVDIDNDAATPTGKYKYAKIIYKRSTVSDLLARYKAMKMKAVEL